MTNDGGMTGVPRLYHPIMPRKEIMRTLDETPLAGAVYMVAPYGCGKTVAVQSWIEARSLRAVWLTISENENAAQAFATLVAKALLPYENGCEHGGRPDAPVVPDADADAFLAEAARRIVRGEIPVDAMVLDNFHHITDTALLRAVRGFVDELLGRKRVIILSRANLPPVFNDLILKLKIRLVSMDELRFSAEEMTEYFAINGNQTTPEGLEAVYADTEGWPAALNVISAISHGRPVAYGQEAISYVRGFFEDEIWGGLDEDARDFLMRTSVLDVLTPSSCFAVTGIGTVLPLLNWLYARGFFISSVAKDTFRYRHVFRRFLYDKLTASGIDVKGIEVKAGWWHYERREYERAFICFYNAEDFYGLSRVLRMVNSVYMGGIERYIDLVSRITDIDVERLKPYPLIIARIALIQFLTGNIDVMYDLLPLIHKWSEPGELPITPDEYAEFLWERGWLDYLNPAEPTLNQKHLDWINIQSRMPHMERLMTDRIAAMCFPSMLRGVRDVAHDGTQHIEPALRRVEAGEKGVIDLEQSVWMTYIMLAELYYERERLAQAEAIVRKIMAIVENKRYTFIVFMCVALLVKIMRARHDTGEIDALAAHLHSRIVCNGDMFLLPNFHAFMMRNRLASGTAGFTPEFEAENGAIEGKMHFYLMYRHFTFARGLISLGEYNRAMVLLGNLELFCRRYMRFTDLIEVYSLSAVSLNALGDADGARRYMAEAIAIAREPGLVRVFSDDAADVLPILDSVKKRSADTYLNNVIISCKKALSRGAAANGQRAEKLTKAELRVLKALQTGMSYAEIALDSGIQVSTVKSHVRSIYSKLHVTNRTSAVMAAMDAGFIV